MRNSINLFAYALLFVILSSCEKVVDLDLRNDTGELVIDAAINDQTGIQTIRLSENVPFSNTNAYPPVTGAAVRISDNNGNNYIFSENVAGIYTANPIAGIPGQTYQLSVITKDGTFKANSTMPSLVKLDSITYRKDIFESDEDNRIISVHFKDPAVISNQYRFVVYINDVLVKRVFVNDDQFSDGRAVTFDLELDDDDIKVSPGDKVTVEMQCVDKPVFTYWYSLAAQQTSDGPGGSVTPSNPPTNITPKAFGYFSAHTTESKTIVIRN
jgi:hypothetical protein